MSARWRVTVATGIKRVLRRPARSSACRCNLEPLLPAACFPQGCQGQAHGGVQVPRSQGTMLELSDPFSPASFEALDNNRSGGSSIFREKRGSCYGRLTSRRPPCCRYGTGTSPLASKQTGSSRGTKAAPLWATLAPYALPQWEARSTAMKPSSVSIMLQQRLERAALTGNYLHPTFAAAAVAAAAAAITTYNNSHSSCYLGECSH